ncbi:hypothetical protein [Ruegeria profundi]|uniref:Uncharacterized protein n=1 Tax=Ruegeria profundi TaxID=1685378 RepID=A0A0X3TRU3_9RHOB|nr:hypothetical protein [Ruegeria profundi]KUJ77186.1 hypothetical protein AVO44_18445 [Ruegeria profundi]MCA0927948.1 hypothetical protein [Ruegeria profundi]
MKDPELTILIKELETRSDLSVGDLDGVAHGLTFLFSDRESLADLSAQDVSGAEQALHIADVAFPNWSVNIHGRANEKDGHWRCSLRESDARDNDAVIGIGSSPVLSQAILAATMRLAMSLQPD